MPSLTIVLKVSARVGLVKIFPTVGALPSSHNISLPLGDMRVRSASDFCQSWALVANVEQGKREQSTSDASRRL